MKNRDIMDILESIAKEWAKEKSDVEKEAVVSYLNQLCAKWMGGNWGLKVAHITTEEVTKFESEPFRVVIDREKMERRYVLQIQSEDGSWKSQAPLPKRDFILKYGFEPEWPHEPCNYTA